jgi:phosphoserine phosphatase
MSEYSSIASTGPSAAFFDLDRTLISGSSPFVFGVAAWKAGLIAKRQFAKDAVSALAFRASGASDETSHGVRDRILGAVQGVRRDDLVGLNTEIVPKLMERVRPEAQQLVEMHRHAGRATYIVSASPIELVNPLAAALGMTGGIATVSEIVDGVYTGRARRAVLLRRGEGGRDPRTRPLGGSRSRPVLRLQRLGERPADARRRWDTRWR